MRRTAARPDADRHGTRSRAFAAAGPARAGGRRLPARTGGERAGPRRPRTCDCARPGPCRCALAPGSQPLEMPVAPRYEPHFGSGWHDMEVQPGVGYFRWMSGPTRRGADRVAAAPCPSRSRSTRRRPWLRRLETKCGSSIGGRDLGARPLMPTRGVYTWDVPADAVREGVNAIVLAYHPNGASCRRTGRRRRSSNSACSCGDGPSARRRFADRDRGPGKPFRLVSGRRAAAAPSPG